MELPQPQDGSAVHEAIQLDEVDNTPSIEEDDIISSIEYDGIMPTIITFNDAYTIESDNDSEFEEIERCVTSDNELLNDEHADEPRSSLRSHTVPLESWKTDVQSCQVNGLTLYAGGTMTVSFDNGGQVEYLTILYLRQDLLDKEDVTLVGRRFLKTNHPDFGGSLDTNLKDEVAWVACDYPGRKLGHLFEVPSESVIEQRQIVMTNALTPSGSNGTWNIHEDIVCRWKVVLYYPKATRCKPKQSVVRKLQAAECNTQWYVPKDEIQIYSRGETVKGGSLYGWRPFEPARLSEESRNRQLFAAPFAIQAVQPTTNQSGHVTIILDDDSDNDILEVTVTAGSSHQDRRESSRQRGMTRLQRRRLARRMLSHSRHFLANERRIRSVATHIGASRQDHYERFRQLKTTRVQRLSSAPQSLSSILAAGEPRRASNNSVAGQAHPDTSLVQRYTFGDAFCGGGGVSRGAQMAGLAVAWGFDRGPDQCQTWSTNFPYAEIFHCDVTAFLGAKIDVKIDILHLSPPCQPYSSANTRPNEKKDEANIAACFAISDLIEKCKPRLVTMENTSGLFDRKPEWFHRFINLFLARDYSVRWSLLDMANYGVPQSRQRLIIIAAGPGDVLPTFPPYTHAKAIAEATPPVGLAPWVSINIALSNIPPHCPDHDVLQAMRRGNGPKPAPDGNSIAKCVTCKGGDNDKHPNGYRGYTNREFACLQTFPLYHEFRPAGVNKLSTVREQIGNAVPPRFAKVLFAWLKKSLEKADGVAPDVTEID